MAESRFWRVMAVAAIGGLFYLAHGLHGRSDHSWPTLLPDMASRAAANDIVTTRVPMNQKELLESPAVLSRSPDGQTIYVFRWVVEDNKPALIYISTASAQRQ